MILDRVSVIAAMAKKNITIVELSNLSTVSISTIALFRFLPSVLHVVAEVLQKTVPSGSLLPWMCLWRSWSQKSVIETRLLDESISSFFFEVAALQRLSRKQGCIPLKILGNLWHSGILHGKG